MQILFLLYNIYLVKSQLLTHNAIGEKIASIQGLFNQKQIEWLRKNKHNELILITYVRYTNFKCIIVPIIKNYLAETTNTSVYVVSVQIEPKFVRYTLNTFSLAKYASEIIKECVKTNKPYKQEKYGLIWECWKIAPDDDYEKLKEQIDKADMLYIDGFCDGHDSYEEFVSHYLHNNEFMCNLKYKIIINLQKTIENNNTYMNAKEMSNRIQKNKSFFPKIEIVKFLNCKGDAILDTIQPQVQNRTFVIGDHYKVKKIRNNVNVEKAEFCGNGSVPVFKYLQKVMHEQYKIEMYENLNIIKQNKFRNLDLKIINYDALEIYAQRFSNYRISFITFVREKKQQIKIVQDNLENECNTILTNYEAVIIVSICAFKDKYRHIITYPVLDANGQPPDIDYDTEDNYYKELIKQHDKVQMFLDTIYDIYQNDCIIDDQKSLLLHKLLDLRKIGSFETVKWTEKIELKDIDIPYHQQNIEFIKNLQSNFGKNITIDLYNVKYDADFSNHLFKREFYHDLFTNYSYKNKIDTKTYLEKEHNDGNDVVLMVLNIRNTKGEDSTYYFIHDKYTNQKNQKNFNKYVSKNNKKLITKLKAKTKKVIKNYFKPNLAMYNNFVKSYMIEHLEKAVYNVIDHLKNDYKKLINYDYVYFQKMLLLAKKELVDQLQYQNAKISRPYSRNVFLNNVNTTINQAEDSNNINKQQYIPNIEFILKKHIDLREIDMFINVLLQPNKDLYYLSYSKIYFSILKSMRNILVDEILKKKNIIIERNRKIYLQVKQITASRDDYDTIKKCIDEIFVKKRRSWRNVFYKRK